MKLSPGNISIIKRLLVGRNNRPLRSILSKLAPADAASLMGLLNPREIRLLFDALLSVGQVTQTLMEVPEQQLSSLLSQLEEEQLFKLIVYSSEEDAAYFLHIVSETMGEEVKNQILKRLEIPKRQRIQQFLNYPEDSAGRMMQTQIFCVNSHLTVAQGLEVIRTKAQEQSIYYIYCVSGDEKDPVCQEEGQKTYKLQKGFGRLEGVVSLRQLATSKPDKRLKDLIKGDIITVSVETSSEDVARLVSHYDFIAIPVVDANKQLLGIITIDDILDIIQDQATANIYAQAGLQEDDRVFSTYKKKIKNRLPWMLLNLILAAIASSVVSLFENTMSEIIILASLKNIVAGMSGNTAIQTLTVITRGIATGDFNFIPYSKAVIKEISVGLSIGLIMGLFGGILTYLWKGQLNVSIILCISMIISSVIASTAGSLTPIFLQKMGKDPALGSGVLVTMITDISSYLSFLGIASMALYYWS